MGRRRKVSLLRSRTDGEGRTGRIQSTGHRLLLTLQGWIKGVNLQGDHDAEATNNAQKYVSKDAFSYALHYYQNDYQSISGNFGWTADEYVDLYNGNIAAMRTILTRNGLADMTYQYDQLNRITEAYNQNRGYLCKYTYDANGNMLSLRRDNANDITIDNLSYTYNITQNNRLQSVNDVSGNNEGLESGIHNYTYDEIGNLTSDKDIQEINWTVYRKIESVLKRDGTTISYKYDGTGQRIYKKVNNTETHYVRDASGNLMATYENKIAKEFVIYGSSRLGIYNGNTSKGKRTLGNKKYELSNHLGNVLSVITDNKIGIDSDIDLVADYYEPLVISESDYYPFGMAMKERSFSNEEYRFGFNGMEEDRDLGEETYTTEFRLWKPEIIRWMSIDPKYKEYESPYVWNTNNPISYTDIFGSDSTEIAQFVERARMYVAARNKNGGNLYDKNSVNSGKKVSPSEVENGAVLDCAAFMIQCLREFNIPLGKWKLNMNGVETIVTSSMIQNIASAAKGAKSHLSQEQVNQAVVGYLVTFRSKRSEHKGEDGKFDHIGVISKVYKDKSGNIIKFDVIEAGGEIGPRERFTYEVNNPSKWDYYLKGMWKWDQTPDEVIYDVGTLNRVEIRASPTLSMEELLEEAKKINNQLQQSIDTEQQIREFINNSTQTEQQNENTGGI